MSSSTSHNHVQDPDTRTLFSVLPQQFTESGDKLRTEHFLAATSGLLYILEKFGKVFTPIIYDMRGNIKKLTDRFNEAPETNKYLHYMILSESGQSEVTATDALLWIRRTFQFASIFFQCIIKDSECERCCQDLSAFVKKAYTESLENYHGWLGTQLFNVLSRFCPNRKTLFYVLGLDSHNKEAIVLRDMRIYTQKLNSMIGQLTDFYKQYYLDATEMTYN